MEMNKIFAVVREVVGNNYWSRNLIGLYYFWVISPRNSTLFTRPFLTGMRTGAGHKTNTVRGAYNFMCTLVNLLYIYIYILYIINISVKMELSFQQAICYLSFRSGWLIIYIYNKLIISIHIYIINISVKMELSFQQAICYLSFRWMNILHAWTVNCVNRLAKTHYSNHLCTQTWPLPICN